MPWWRFILFSDTDMSSLIIDVYICNVLGDTEESHSSLIDVSFRFDINWHCYSTLLYFQKFFNKTIRKVKFSLLSLHRDFCGCISVLTWSQTALTRRFKKTFATSARHFWSISTKNRQPCSARSVGFGAHQFTSFWHVGICGFQAAHPRTASFFCICIISKQSGLI